MGHPSRNLPPGTLDLFILGTLALGLACGLVQVADGIVLYLSGVYFEPWSLRLMILLLAVSIAAGNW
jgi:hypothetical protein